MDSTQLTSRELQALNTQAVIIDAAEEQFLANGFGGCSLGAIASAAKVSKGLILHHFKNKEALWAAVIERHQEEMNEALDAIRSEQGTDIEQFFRGYFRWLADHPQHQRFLLLRALEGGEPITDSAFDTVLPLFAEGQRSGNLRDDLPAEHMLHAMLGLIRSWHVGKALRDHEHDTREEELLLRIFLDGIRA